ncbi:regulator of G-protein signaling 12-like isoform X1 [Strongylocentrotus purpuratus]|uniref:Uncharacterized protein n=1 Tax=Strongylocentrotus purpuratus TaxID=7668 RepID=A0A7M7SYR1_STRPU|nr:regulator of G-protein signaling 12-like isoform X1 [Strongylocentrotus purpuratus]
MYPGRRKAKLPRTSAMNLKTVEVPRGRNGYGFTVSGQSPCVLSCILHGSPAEIAGIKTGDSVIAVNGENVTRLSHEQIIKLIGATTGVLRLTVAEVDYSESSDDEYVYMPRTRYPHTKRSQSATPLSMIGNKPRAEMVVEEMQQGALLDSFSMHADMPQAMLRGAEVQHIQADVQISASKFAPGHLSPLNMPGNGELLLKRSPNYDYSYWNGKGVEKMNIPPKTRKPRRQNDPRNRLFSTPTPTSYYIRENPYDDNDPDMRPLSPVELSHLMYPGNVTSHDTSRGMHKSTSLQGNASRNVSSVSQGHSLGASLMENNENFHMRAMVGYLGSIDIPASANLPTASLHAIRGCVRRLHKEHRIHSFMMMEIRTDGVRLVNSNQRIAVVYPRERLAFSGVCPDDKRFFGIVTSQNPEEILDTLDSDDEPIGSSCHVFMVDPEFRRHDVHARVISQFGVPCNTNPETNTCDIFPSSAKPILQHVSQLYRDRSDLSYFGELYGQSTFVSGPRRSNSTNSSNSDSGFGNGNSTKDQSDFNAHMDQSHHNPILDVASLMRNKRGGGGGNRHIVQADVNASLSSDVPYSLSSTSPQSIDTSPQNMYFKNTKDISGRLTPRARPDPVGFRSPSVVPVQQENAFRYQQQAARPSSVQVPLQSHIQHSAPPELKQFKQPGIDFNAHKPNAESSGSSTLEDNSQRGKELMGPPKSLPPTGRHLMYSKPAQDYLDGATNQATARKVQQEMARKLSDNQSFHQKQQLLRHNSDCSEYSSSTRLSKQAIERLQKVRHDPRHLTPSNQQTLAASQTELNNDGRGISSSASNPNLAAKGSGLAELDPSIGRVSSWAVDFERLLTDELGLACFTEFLKKEFSDENIMFWIACEKMSKIKDHKELQRTAEEIYAKHLATKAPMPVNLDSSARSLVEGAMKNPTPEMYKVQQLQIFKLMKFDSYSRFLKSKLYQDCVLAEMGGLPLPISLEKVSTADSEPSAGDLEDSGGVHSGSGGISSESSSYEKGGEKNGGVTLGGTVKDRMERKKSGPKRDTNRNGIPTEKEDDGQEKKRSSILPWRNKTKKVKDVDKTSSCNEDTSVSSRHSSVTSSDFRPAGDKFVDMNHCFHMIFPNNEILTLTPDPQQSVKGILLPLLEERGLGLQNVEIFLNDTKESVESVKQKLINLDQLATEMIGKQIVVERRVVFKIELPNKRVIGVKSKLTKKIIEVLRPVTYKYKLQLDALVVHLSDSPVPLDLDITVASLDAQRILIETLEQYSAGSYSFGGRASVGARGESQQKSGEVRSSSVDSYLKDDETVRADSSKVVKEKLTAQVSAPAMSAFQAAPQGDTMREQRHLAAAAAAKTPPQVNHLPPSSSSVSTSALVGKGRTEGRAEARKSAGNLKVTGKETEDLIAMVTKVQGKRLDDQRGLTLRNLELPDFLKVSAAPTSSSSSTKPVDSRPKSALAQPYRTNAPASKPPNQEQGELKAINIEALKLRPKSTPPRQGIMKGDDDDAFVDGVFPTQDQADALFGSGSPRSPVVRFDDTVVSSSHRETSWGQGSNVNYPQNTDKLRPSVASSYQSRTSSFETPDSKLSPRAYGNGKINGNDSTDYGQNTTAYSLEFNSSFGSMDQPNLLDTTLTSTPSESHLPPPPNADMDTTIQADLPNYTPPPAIGVNQPRPAVFAKMGSQSTPDVRKTPFMHPFRSGSTLPGHNITPKPVVEANGYVSKAYTRSISSGQLSYSNNNNTNVPLPVSAPDIKVETNNCYSNYCPLPTTPNGSSYGGSSTNIDDVPMSPASPVSPAPPDVTQVLAKERVIKPPPAYHSSMSTRQSNPAFTSSEHLQVAPTYGQGNRQGATQSATWSSSTVNPGSGPSGRPSNGATWAGPRGNAPQVTSTASTSAPRSYRGPVPYASIQPPRAQPSSQGAVPKSPVSGNQATYSNINNLDAGASGGAKGGEGSGEGYQGKETVVISKDGRKLRATFV